MATKRGARSRAQFGESPPPASLMTQAESAAIGRVVRGSAEQLSGSRGTWRRVSLQGAWLDILGVSMLAGIGFTVSLLVGDLAFGQGSALDDDVKVGVLVGSLTASLTGLTLLFARARRYRRVVADQPQAAG